MGTGYSIYDKPDFIPMYADKAVANVPELRGVLGEIKKRLKMEFDKSGMEERIQCLFRIAKIPALSAGIFP